MRCQSSNPAHKPLRRRRPLCASVLLATFAISLLGCGGDENPRAAGTPDRTDAPAETTSEGEGECDTFLDGRQASATIGVPLASRRADGDADSSWDFACLYPPLSSSDDESGDPLGIYFFTADGDGVERLVASSEETGADLDEIDGSPALVNIGSSYTYITVATPNLMFVLEVDGVPDHEQLARTLSGVVLDNIPS